MSKWDELSLREKAGMMNVAVRNGIYRLDEIRNKYNEFAGGGEMANDASSEVLNEIPYDYAPLVSNTFQSMVDNLKSSNADFNVDDYTYRVQKLHPEVTREQVESLYNSTPFIASDKVKGVQYGGFREGDETGYGRRVTIYPNAITKDTGESINSKNTKDLMEEVMAHETGHLYTDVLLGGNNEQEEDLLWDAYRPGLVFSGDLEEARERNREFQKSLSRSHDGAIKEDLDKVIDNMTDDEIMKAFFDTHSGYINKNAKKHMQDKNGKWNRADAVRRALKDVAYNPYGSEINPNYAAFGGPIMENTRKFAKGGSTSDDDLIDFIIKEEGFNSKPEDIGDGKTTLGSGLTASKWHELYKKRGNKWSAADNRRAVSEEVASRRRWAERNIPNWDTLPESSQKALLSYKYNYDFNRSNSPKLFAALEAGNLQEVARQMDATSKDPKFRKGLSGRRKREQEWFLSDVWSTPKIDETFVAPTVSTAVYNPYRQQAEATQIMPFTIPSDYVQTREVSPSEQRAEKIKERFDAINNFNRVMNLFGIENTAIPEFDGFLGTLGLFIDDKKP